MTTNTNTTTEARERPVELVEQLRAAGVENSLASKVLDCIETERAKAIAKAARLFYHSDEPIPAVQFPDELSAMARRLWGLVAAASELVEGHDGPLPRGVLQIAEDATKEMERLAEAFEAERWLARGTGEPQS
jgi:hypothetical protein